MRTLLENPARCGAAWSCRRLWALRRSLSLRSVSITVPGDDDRLLADFLLERPMTILVFCAVLIAALLHASWNGLVKTGDNKQTGILLLTLVHAFFGLCLIPFLPMP